MNREQWLTDLTDKLRPLYENFGEHVPEKIRLTCGWPSKGAFAQKSRRVGECWLNGSADETVEIFISPCISNGQEIAGILAHELVHACGKKGHGASFKRLATFIGLEGKMRATKPGQLLQDRLNVLVNDLGPYPHAALDKNASPIKKDTTRMIKVICTSPGCGYTVRTTQKWIEVGMPTCCCGQAMGLAE